MVSDGGIDQGFTALMDVILVQTLVVSPRDYQGGMCIQSRCSQQRCPSGSESGRVGEDRPDPKGLWLQHGKLDLNIVLRSKGCNTTSSIEEFDHGSE